VNIILMQLEQWSSNCVSPRTKDPQANIFYNKIGTQDFDNY